jgi:hypothetical protein
MNRAALLHQRVEQTACALHLAAANTAGGRQEGDPRFGQQAGAQQLRQDRGVDLGVLQPLAAPRGERHRAGPTFASDCFRSADFTLGCI